MSKVVREKLPWRDAATLIVVARNKLKSLLSHYDTNKIMLNCNDVTDYLILTLQRHSRSSFMVWAYIASLSVNWAPMYFRIWALYECTDKELSNNQ